MKQLTREIIHDWWKPVSFWLLTLALVLGFSITNGRTQRALEKVAVETHTALCTLNNDLERRLEDTVRYLERHPGKEPIPGISRADLRRSIQNQRDTLDALSVLECEGGES